MQLNKKKSSMGKKTTIVSYGTFAFFHFLELLASGNSKLLYQVFMWLQ